MRDLKPEDSGKEVIVDKNNIYGIPAVIYYDNKEEYYYILSDNIYLDGSVPLSVFENEIISKYRYSWCVVEGTVRCINENEIKNIEFIEERVVKETIKQDKKMVTHKFETNGRLVTLGLSYTGDNQYGVVMAVRNPNDVIETDDVLKQVEFEQKSREIVKSTLEGRVRKEKFIQNFSTDLMSRSIAKGYLIEIEHRIKKDFNSYVPLGKKAK